MQHGTASASAPDGPVAGLCPAWPRAAGGRAGRRTTVFTVGNYPVEARADNAVAAKDKALADGQQAAFRSLLKRLVPVTAYPRIRRLASIKAGDLIDGYKVRSERNSATRIHRQPRLLVPVEGRARPAAPRGHTLLGRAVADRDRHPGLAPTGRPAHRGDDPTWTNIWKGFDLEHALTPVKLQTCARRSSLSTINALAGGDGTAIRVARRSVPQRAHPDRDGESSIRRPSASTSRCRAEMPWAPSRCRAPTGSTRRTLAIPASWRP